MRSSIRNRFTIYDAMEARGVFASNPANVDSVDQAEGTSLYTGPVEYPKMMYHPEGSMRVTVPGEVIVDPLRGPIIVGEQREIIFEIVTDAKAERKLRDAGWHDHPARAIAASGGEPPPISSAERIRQLEESLAKTQAELIAAKSPASLIPKKQVA